MPAAAVTDALVPATDPRTVVALVHLEAMYLLALGTGMRQGELLGLRWSDVDFEHDAVTVRHQLQWIDRTWTLTEPKSARSRRTLAVDPAIMRVLKEHRVRQLEERLIVGDEWKETIADLVFRNSVGNPLDAPAVTHRFQRTLERAGLPRMRFHDLRHGAASLLLSQGVHARVVMEQLGHSQISLTMNTYAHVAPELQREAASRLGAVLTGAG